jgi:hypothetical protein
MLAIWIIVIVSLYLFAGIFIFNLWKDKHIWKNNNNKE